MSATNMKYIELKMGRVEKKKKSIFKLLHRYDIMNDACSYLYLSLFSVE